MKKKKMFVSLFLIMAVAAGFMLGSGILTEAAAGKITSVTLQAAGRNVTKKTLTVSAGSKTELKVNASPARQVKDIQYQSQKKSIASINKKGIITAKKTGTAKITVTVSGKGGGKKTAWMKVKVKRDPAAGGSTEGNNIKIRIGNRVFTAALVDNSSTRALKEILAKGPLTINMRDYGDMEKVGSLGQSLPRNDEEITTKAGDLILYQGNSFVIYYAPNTWDFTRLGRINDVAEEELKRALGSGSVTVTLSLD